jgi:hypothetical protein
MLATGLRHGDGPGGRKKTESRAGPPATFYDKSNDPSWLSGPLPFSCARRSDTQKRAGPTARARTYVAFPASSFASAAHAPSYPFFMPLRPETYLSYSTTSRLRLCADSADLRRQFRTDCPGFLPHATGTDRLPSVLDPLLPMGADIDSGFTRSCESLRRSPQSLHCFLSLGAARALQAATGGPAMQDEIELTVPVPGLVCASTVN